MAQRWTAWGKNLASFGGAVGFMLALSIAMLWPRAAVPGSRVLGTLFAVTVATLGVVASLRFFQRDAVRTVGRNGREFTNARDFSRHRELETALQALVRSDRRVEQIRGSELFGVLFWDGEGRITGANRAAQRLLERSEAELTREGLRWPQLLAVGPPNVADRALETLDREGHCPPFETVVRKAGGKEAPVLLGAVRLGGPAAEGVAFLLDISERKRAEQSLRFLVEASTHLAASLDYRTTLARVARLLVSGLADWCVVELEDHEGVLRRVAVAHAQPSKDALVQKLFGLSPPFAQAGEQRPPVLGRTAAEIVENPRTLMRELAVSEADARVVSELGCRSAMVVPLVARGRTLGALLLVSSSPEHTYDTEDLALAEDLARRCAVAVDNARLYLEAQEAVRARDEFLSIASHELKTPLTSLHLQLQSVRRAARRGVANPLTLQELEPRLVAADGQVRRLARLIEQLLDSSRIRLGRMELALEELDLAVLTRDLVNRFDEVGAHSKPPISFYSEGPVWGIWDRLRMEQVVTNLLSNAVKYGSERPIEVLVERHEGLARLTVRDRGMGIALDQQVRIFERFERAVDAQHFGGMGLGLYIVRQIVDAHGGSVRVQSRPGQGSTFTVELPARPAAAAELPQQLSS